MLIPFSILKNFLDTSKNVHEIADILTNIGLEVEYISKRDDLHNFVVGKIIELHKHPNADKLNVCSVHSGKEVLQIVCGAQNVYEGMHVILAQIGTLIPKGEFKIQETEIRGVKSYGMLCSYEELCLEKKGDGIADLSQDFVVGRGYADQDGLLDDVIHISLTPNRADCASVYGVARDLAAAGAGKLIEPKIEEFEIQAEDFVEIKTKKCLSYNAIKIENVTPTQSPDWLDSDLHKFNLNSRNYLVDITNYIMMNLGQPMHCFDADKVKGKITIREAKNGEKLVDLKERELLLQDGDIVICDDEKIIALAGIIGGLNSCVCDETKNIIFEIANFDCAQITITGQRINVATDARFRFERGVDFNLSTKAIPILLMFIKELFKDDANIKSICSKTSQKDNVKKIKYNFASFEKLIGTSLEKEKQLEIFANLGFTIDEIDDDSCNITPHSARFDLDNENDLIEELARIFGYQNIPLQPLSYLDIKTQKDSFDKDLMVKKMAANLGYDEVISIPFTSEDEIEAFSSQFKENVIELYNPIAQNEPFLQTSSLSGLFCNLSSFISKDPEVQCKLFELATLFNDDKTFASQKSLVFVNYSTNNQRVYKQDEKKSAFVLIKSDLFAILNNFGITQEDVDYEPINEKFAHPFSSFYVLKDGIKIASFGFMNPAFLDEYNIKKDVIFAQIFNVQNFSISPKKSFVSSSSLQPIYREFSFQVSDDIAIGQFINTLSICDERICYIMLNDIYKNEKSGDNLKSISIKCKINQESAMSTEEIDQISAKIVDIATTKFNAKLRDGIV